jgi:mono/diheme cytochrome c family protein
MSRQPQARVPRLRRLNTAAVIATAAAIAGLPLRVHNSLAGTPRRQPAAAPAATAGKVVNGRRLFMRYYCYSCHGTDGQGGIGARLKAPALPPFEAFRSFLRNPAGRMPPYRTSAVSDAELVDIYAYLKSIPAPASAKSIPLLIQ